MFVLNQYCSYEVSQYFLFLLGVNTDSVAEPERFFEETQLCLRYGWSLAIWATLQQTLSFIGIDNEQLIRTSFFFYFFSICEFQTFLARSWLRFSLFSSVIYFSPVGTYQTKNRISIQVTLERVLLKNTNTWRYWHLQLAIEVTSELNSFVSKILDLQVTQYSEEL